MLHIPWLRGRLGKLTYVVMPMGGVRVRADASGRVHVAGILGLLWDDCARYQAVRSYVIFGNEFAASASINFHLIGAVFRPLQSSLVFTLAKSRSSNFFKTNFRQRYP